MCFVFLGNSASGPAIEIDAPSSVQKPPLIFRRGYVPAQCRRKLEISGQDHFSARRWLCPREPGSVGGGARHGADAIVKFDALLLLPAPSANDFDGAFAAMVQERADAFLVVPSPLSTSYRSALAELALKHRLPAMYGHRDYVEAGGLMSYGADIDDLNRRTALYIDKILKGANLPTCPWSRPTIHQSIYCIEPTGAAMVNTNGAERGSCF